MSAPSFDAAHSVPAETPRSTPFSVIDNRTCGCNRTPRRLRVIWPSDTYPLLVCPDITRAVWACKGGRLPAARTRNFRNEVVTGAVTPTRDHLAMPPLTATNAASQPQTIPRRYLEYGADTITACFFGLPSLLLGASSCASSALSSLISWRTRFRVISSWFFMVSLDS